MRTLQHRTSNSICQFYREQLRKFDRIGIGNKTENDVVVTQQLIDITQKRLNQLSVNARIYTLKAAREETDNKDLIG